MTIVHKLCSQNSIMDKVRCKQMQVINNNCFTDFSNMTGFADALLPAYNTYEDLLNTSKCQTDNQRTLIIKLQEVLANNYVLGTSRRDEGAVDDFVHYLLSMLEFDKYPIQVRYCSTY
jgi:hypothetical protein